MQTELNLEITRWAKGERTQNEFPIPILPASSSRADLIKRGNRVFVVPARNYLFLPAVRKFSQFLNGYWKRETGASPTVGKYWRCSSSACKSFNGDKRCHRWDFRLADILRERDRETAQKAAFLCILSTINFYYAWRWMILFIFLGLPGSGSGSGWGLDCFSASFGQLCAHKSALHTPRATPHGVCRKVPGIFAWSLLDLVVRRPSAKKNRNKLLCQVFYFSSDFCANKYIFRTQQVSLSPSLPLSL